MRKQLLKKILIYISVFFTLFGLFTLTQSAQRKKSSTIKTNDTEQNELNEALYADVDLFGVNSRILRPSEDARTRLQALANKYPNNSEVHIKLANKYIELNNVVAAEAEMKLMVQQDNNSPKSLRALATFYHERASFTQEAVVLQQLLKTVPNSDKGTIFYELMDLAELHQLDNYFEESQYGNLLKDDPAGFSLLQKLIDNLNKRKRFNHVYKLLDKYQPVFPDQKKYFIEERVALLVSEDKVAQAAEIYEQAFDPFFLDNATENFYSFLEANQLYTNYRKRIIKSFYQTPDNFRLAMQLYALTQREYNTEQSRVVLKRLEQARTSSIGESNWTPMELATVAQLFIKLQEPDQASRYFYTLHLQGGLPKGSKDREQVLYQLFNSLLIADEKPMVLSASDIRYYKDIAKSDQHPGLLGGMLSLILANTGPDDEYNQSEKSANRYYNRTAAFRILTAYQQEYPQSPVLPQMYADLMQVYAQMDQPKLVDKLVAEYQQRFNGANDYAEVGLEMADIYLSMKETAKAQQLYQHLLDYIGKHRALDKPLVPSVHLQPWEENSRIANRNLVYLPRLSDAPVAEDDENSDDSSASENSDENATDEPKAENNDENSNVGNGENSRLPFDNDLEIIEKPTLIKTSYLNVLDRYIKSLSAKNANEKIVTLFWQEIKKYPKEEGLYERFLQWLSKTNLLNTQLQAYQMAINNVANNKTWQARLARWYIRHERKTEFTQLSTKLMQILDEDEVQEYLQIFIKLSEDSQANDYDAQLYYQLYKFAQNRFQNNLVFVNGLLSYYKQFGKDKEYLNLTLQYYFLGLRDQALQEMAQKDSLKSYYEKAQVIVADSDKNNSSNYDINTIAYQQFRADAAIFLTEYETSVAAYRKLNKLYPGNQEYANRLAMLLRSFGYHSDENLQEAVNIKEALATIYPINEAYRTEVGELYAELGDLNKAREQWDQLLKLRSGDSGVYLDTASIFWDYYQYDDALRIINRLRDFRNDQTLYAFQAGVIYENKHELKTAINEYIKDLAIYQLQLRAIYRLKTLARNDMTRKLITDAVDRSLSSQPNNYQLIIGYARLLDRIGDTDAAAAVFNRYILSSTNIEFLHIARGFFGKKARTSDEIKTLERMIAVSPNGLAKIAYKRQLAAFYEQENQPERSLVLYNELLKDFPNNYGLIITVSKFTWRNNYRDRAIEILKDAATRGLGPYHFEFGIRLANYQALAGQLSAAEEVLRNLYKERTNSEELLSRLMAVLVQEKKGDEIKALYEEALKRAIAKQDRDRQGRSESLAVLYTLTQQRFDELGDYSAALDQNINLINNDPNNTEVVANAYEYARKHNLINALLDYYLKLSKESFKNYRWNVVLARIYELQDDWASAAAQFEKAITNEPQMSELYEYIAEDYLQLKQPAQAIAQLERALKVIDPALQSDYEKKRDAIKNLKFDGHAIARDFLANINAKGDEANNNEQSLKNKFAQLNKDIYQVESYSIEYSIDDYVKLLRKEKDFIAVYDEIWNLRSLVEKEALKLENVNHDKATSLLGGFDRQIPTAIKNILHNGQERFQLNQRVQALLPINTKNDGGKERESLLLNLAHDCGLRASYEQIQEQRLQQAFAQREEKIKDKNNQDSDPYHTQLALVVDYYQNHGQFNRAIEILKNEYQRDDKRSKFDYWRRLSILYQYNNDKAGELSALRGYYREQTGELTTAKNEMIERYFELLSTNGDEGKREFAELATKSHPNKFQLITYLIKKNERDLVYQTIDQMPLSDLWKLTRHAEVSVVLADYSTNAAATFERLLGKQTIGAIVQTKLNAQKDLVGDDRFLLATDYGRWLAHNPDNKDDRTVRLYLLGLIENRPRDAKAQAIIGRWYLADSKFEPAILHLQLALKLAPQDTQLMMTLGEAYWRSGNEAQARKCWQNVIDKVEDPNILPIYFDTLAKLGLTVEAREKLMPILERMFTQQHRDDATNFFTNLQPLIRTIVNSFETPAQASKYLQSFKDRSSSRLLFEMVLNEGLVPDEDEIIFLRRLIPLVRVKVVQYDTDYRNYIAKIAAQDNEAVADQYEFINSSSVDDQASQKWFSLRKQLVDLLIKYHRDQDAAKEITDIAKFFNGRAPQPAWLRLARARINIRLGNTNEALNILMRYCGLQSAPTVINLVNMERAVEARDLLIDEQQEQLAHEFMGRVYQHNLAFNQLTTENFVGYAEYKFDIKDSAGALKTLQDMVNASQVDVTNSRLLTIAETYRTANDLELLKTVHKAIIADVSNTIYDGETDREPTLSNTLRLNSSLAAAAEIALQYGELETANKYEQQFIDQFGINQVEAAHRLRYARLLVDINQPMLAAEIIVATLALPNINYNDQLTALASISYLAQKSPAIIANALQKVNNLPDATRSFLKALQLQAATNWPESIRELDQLASYSLDDNIDLLRGVAAMRLGNSNQARENFINAQSIEVAEQFQSPFLLVIDEPRWQLVRLFAQQGNFHAALFLASKDTRLQPINKPTNDSADNIVNSAKEHNRDIKANPHTSIALLTQERINNSQRDLLTLLADSAEKTGDYALAVRYEQTLLTLIKDLQDVAMHKSRINGLNKLLREKIDQPIGIVIDQRLISQK